ncbi:MAG: choloylglycine hydrolase family protein [Lachnospiraceae bacterium]|nr:choloylglycine hydrolase family protein [Lachnospiraceae bacterium]
MCTAITYQTKDFYFGRTLDHNCTYGDEVTITPRRYPFFFRNAGSMSSHYAIIGMAFVTDEYPLYYDAVNEKGLGIAGLNFVENAVYTDVADDKDNIAQFELIPWILGQCASVREARRLLGRLNVIKTPFNEKLPPAELHWLLADANEAVTIESVGEGLKIYDNPAGVLTNNPPFREQMFQLNNYMRLSPKNPENCFSNKLPLKTYCVGMGALGLPGDLSSESRFARAAFTKMNSICGESDSESISQFFHILGSVEQQRGCCDLGDGNYEVTLYTSCCNASRGVYYYTSYGNRQITGVDMRKELLDGAALIRYPIIKEEQIRMQN